MKVTKTCTKCGQDKPLEEFARAKQGLYNRYSQCKACKRVMKKEWHARNREAENQKSRTYRALNRPLLVNASRRKYRANQAAMVLEARERYKDNRGGRGARRNPEQHRAHVAVSRMVKRGQFPPVYTMVCDKCGEAQAAHWHHHRGYVGDAKLDVIPLCTLCHGEEHRTPL